MMTKLNATSYAGMLDQNGFKQWYKYLKLRIAYRYQMEEVSFLMSRPPFYFRDYEMLAVGARITFQDEAILSKIFHQQKITEQWNFDKDHYGVSEKRVIRIRREESLKEITYFITIPWTIKGNDSASKLRLCKRRRTITTEEESEIRNDIGVSIDGLVMQGFFRCNRSALDVFHAVEEGCQWSPLLRPAYVKEALYQQIGLNNLFLKTVSGQLLFQEKI